MLKLNNISFSYKNNISILDNISANFEPGKVVAIQGESGQGKSTLLSILSGLENQYQGDIVLDENIINKAELHKYNKDNISIVFQELNLINYLNLDDNLNQGSLVKNVKVNNEMKAYYLEMFGIKKLNLNEYPHKISGGQQQRIAIIRALLSDTKIILADEPTASIDHTNSMKIIKLIKQLAAKEKKDSNNSNS